MSRHFLLSGVRCYLPKARIKRKLEKRKNIERYMRHTDGRAAYNSMFILCWVIAQQEPKP